MPSDRDQLLLEVLLQLGGRRKKSEDWITIATKVSKLIEAYPSVEELAVKLQVSPQMVRSIASLLRLPPEVRRLVRQGKILYDAAYRLRTLPTSDRQVEVALQVQGLKSHAQRAAIQYALGHSADEVERFVARLKSPSREVQRTHLLVIPVAEEQMNRLKRYSRENRITVSRAVAEAIASFVEGPSKP